ncbi:MAG: RNA polymerase sigma factor [Gemmatimonadetes bacterium]|nr:RNA polymerase sigma factor [Gemmatimonadota bacterium]
MKPGDPIEQFPPRPRPTDNAMGSLKMESLKTMTDAELVTLTKEGNLNAFNQLAGRWESSLFGFTRRTLGNAEDARDVCQEALVKAFQNIARLRDGGKFKSWVHYIALNLCRDRFRSPKARAELLPFDESTIEDAPALHGEATDARAEQSVLSDVLQSVLEELPQEQRSSILLREFQGFTSEEIGEMMGVPAATVRTRIYYGLKTMRRVLEERGIQVADFS